MCKTDSQRGDIQHLMERLAEVDYALGKAVVAAGWAKRKDVAKALERMYEALQQLKVVVKMQGACFEDDESVVS